MVMVAKQRSDLLRAEYLLDMQVFLWPFDYYGGVHSVLVGTHRVDAVCVQYLVVDPPCRCSVHLVFGGGPTV